MLISVSVVLYSTPAVRNWSGDEVTVSLYFSVMISVPKIAPIYLTAQQFDAILHYLNDPSCKVSLQYYLNDPSGKVIFIIATSILTAPPRSY